MKCPVGQLTNIHPHPNRPDLRIAEILGHQVVVGDHYMEGNLGFYIPPGAVLPKEILVDMWLWNFQLDKGRLSGKKGCRVKTRQVEGVTSDGLFYGAYYFDTKPIPSRAWKNTWIPGHDVSQELGITFQEAT